MKRACILITLLTLSAICLAQSYEMTFKLGKEKDSILYIGQHYQDKFTILDSAVRQPGNVYVFKGKKKWERGIYALIGTEVKKKKERKQVCLFDFTIDGSQKFSIMADSNFSMENMIVKGSPSNQAMYSYMGRRGKGMSRSKELNAQMKTSDSIAAKKELDKLSEEMISFEEKSIKDNQKYLFFELLDQFNGPDVPEDIENKSVYYRMHYWDGVNLADHSLVNTPDLFNKMNYYFFGLLYYADADTICKYADRVLSKVEGDSVMMKYFLEFVMPKYYRSTKNIGWDQVWCYLVEEYYLKGRCEWATEGDVSNKRKTARFLEKSLIGAYGQELIMSDTTQLPTHQISSHRLPQKYVILWFWDPDCHHCQEQTAALIEVYNQLEKEGKRNFEVFAVGYESDVAKWKRYVKDHNLPFLNVGGPNVNIDYQEAYNVHGAPTMIILNADRQIIMNKSIPASSIEPFLEQYEKQHPEQKDRSLSVWQRNVPKNGFVEIQIIESH